MEVSGYTIEREIGQGGMATVYLGVQNSLGRKVVLKVMSNDLGDTPEYAKRFLNEGHMLAALNHPNIITIHDIGISEDFLYLAMEYLRGGSLMRRMSKGITREEALDIVIRIGSALSVAHSKGIVHRDVKPANILYREDGVPVLTDFGIAKQAGDNELTSTGTILGSPFYMSPEQIEGKLQLDGRSDIYSLGIILFEMLTGNRPFEGDSAINIVLKHLQDPIPSLPEHLQKYQPLINLMLAKNRSDRFPDAASMVDYINAIENPTSTDSTQRINRHAPHQAPKKSARPYKEGEVTQGMKQIRSTHIKYWVFGSIFFITLSIMLGVYFVIEITRYNQVNITQKSTETSGYIQSPIVVSPPVATNEPGINSEAMDGFRKQVLTALTWLAKKALQQKRYVSPPEDNAYYYFSRILELEPTNESALAGLKKVAEGIALLAESNTASGRFGKAQNYIIQGLSIDPENKRLQVLQSQLKLREKSIMERLKETF